MPGRLKYRAVTALIVALLGLQMLTASRLLCPPKVFSGLSGMRVCCPPLAWPFLDYPMFSEAHYAGESVEHFFATGTLADGTALQLQPGDRRSRLEPRRVVAALIDGDEAALRRFAGEFRDEHGIRLVELRLQVEDLTLSRDGFVAGRRRTLSRVELAPGKAE